MLVPVSVSSFVNKVPAALLLTDLDRTDDNFEIFIIMHLASALERYGAKLGL
jgi:hypothetical protein